MKVKLIIWDLDDTLWSGALAEGDTVRLFEERAEIIKRLNNHGIVSSVNSKNDFEAAKAKLEEFGLWRHLVFCRIAFVPKGEAVFQLIEDMQLRAENVLFVDDNPVNLGEVAHANPGIHTLDASTDACNEVLRKVLAENAHITKSRVEEYRGLEARLLESRNSGVDREAFLASCEIRACLIPRGDNVPFVNRIEELINRTNQLIGRSPSRPAIMREARLSLRNSSRARGARCWLRYRLSSSRITNTRDTMVSLVSGWKN